MDVGFFVGLYVGHHVQLPVGLSVVHQVQLAVGSNVALPKVGLLVDVGLNVPTNTLTSAYGVEAAKSIVTTSTKWLLPDTAYMSPELSMAYLIDSAAPGSLSRDVTNTKLPPSSTSAFMPVARLNIT